MSRRKSKKTTVGSAPLPTVVSAKMTPRNPVAGSPLLGKSGAHGKTRKADRRANNVSLRKLPLERSACSHCVITHWADQAFGSSGSLPTVCSAV